MRASNTPIKQACSLDKSSSDEMRYVCRDLRCEKKICNSVKGFEVELRLKRGFFGWEYYLLMIYLLVYIAHLQFSLFSF